MTSQITHFAHL